MGRRRAGRLISILVATALLGFGAVAGGVALADDTVSRDPGTGPVRVPGDTPGDTIPGNPERGPGGGPVDPGGGGGGPVVPVVPATTPGGGGTVGVNATGGGIGGGGTGSNLIPGVVDLALTKTDSPDPVFAGANLTYTITVTNDGELAAPDATVQDQLPVQTAPVSSTPSQGSCTHTGGGEVCSLGPIAGGGTATVTFVVRVLPDVPAGTILSNTAVTFTTATEGTTNNNDDTATTTVAVLADVAVMKTNSPNPVPTGTNLTYSIPVGNLGPSDAQNVSLTDTLPAGTTFVSLTAPAGWTTMTPPVGGTGIVTATKATLAANGSGFFTLVVHVTVPSGNLINNTATVTATTTDPNAANNSATSQASVSGSADVSVTKTDNPDPVTAGSNLSYTVTVSNAGGDFANNVALTDALPAATTFVSLTSPAGWTCTTPAAGANGTVTCSNPSVAPTTSGAFTLIVKVNPNTAGGSSISNTASVSSSTFDPNPVNNSATTTTAVNAVADLSVTKTDSPDPVIAGTNLTYTIGVSNAGPSAAHNATLTDTLPSGTTFVSLTSPAGWSCTTPAAGAGGTVSCGNAALAPGSVSFTLVVHVSSSTANGATIANNASVATATTDPNAANNTSVASTSVDTVADVSATKTDSPDPVVAGTNLTYIINVSNAGPSDAQNVAIGDDLPVGVSYVSANPSQGTCSFTTAVDCTLGTIANGGSATITITVRVGSGLSEGSQLVNNGSVAASTTDPNSPNNSFTATTTVATSADLAVTKADSPDPVTAGTDLTYTIGVKNNGPSHTGGDVTVTDPLPAGTTFVSATPSVGSCSGTTTVSCDLGPMASGASASITVVVHVDAAVPEGATLANTASVSSATSDPNTENNSATEETGVVASADVGLAKHAAPDPVTAGTDLTYTITATNHGPSDAQDVTVTDPLPAGTAFVSVTPSQGSCSGTTTVTCNLGTIANGASSTITLAVNVDVATPGGTVITNTATVSSPEPEVTATTADPAKANDAATAKVTVLAAPKAPEASTGASSATATAAFAVVAVPRFTG